MIRPWVLWTMLAIFCWGVWALLGKFIGESLSPALTQALSTLGLVPIFVALGFSQRLTSAGNRRRGSLLALAAGGLACLGNIVYYGLLSSGAKAATVVALTALYPLVTILCAVILLKERLSMIQSTGVACSLGAIYLFNVQQEQNLFSSWLLVALIPVVFWGIAGLFQKLATNDVSGELSTLWFLIAFVPVAGCILSRQSIPVGLSLRTWLLVAGLGFTFALGNYALLAAFAREGKASVIMPLAGLYPVVSIPAAIIFLHERIGWREALGIILALVSAAALSWESPPSSGKVPNLNPEAPR